MRHGTRHGDRIAISGHLAAFKPGLRVHLRRTCQTGGTSTERLALGGWTILRGVSVCALASPQALS